MKKRDSRNAFREAWSTVVDPADIFIDRSATPSPGPVIELLKSGEPASKVDLLILGDGYTAAESGKFEKDARRLVDILFAFEPFKSRKADFNVWGLCPASAESGIARPSTGRYRRSPVGATYDAFGSERYVLTFDNRAFRDIASHAPYDVVEILANGQTYGGGGIFNLYATVASDSAWAPYVFVHEFGHHFAGLADEVLHLGCGVPARRRSRRAVGDERDGAPRPGVAQVEGPGDSGHAVTNPVGQGRLRDVLARHPGEAPCDSGR